jgi:uncharacterized membrane protein (DUF106 family)
MSRINKRTLFILIVIINIIEITLTNNVCSTMVRESLTEKELMEKLTNKMHELKNETNQ